MSDLSEVQNAAENVNDVRLQIGALTKANNVNAIGQHHHPRVLLMVI